MDIDERPAARVSIWIVTILLLAAALTGCGSVRVRDDAVPGCPRCGDPVTRTDPAGRAEVVARLRIVDGTLGGPGAGKSLAPWSLGPGAAQR